MGLESLRGRLVEWLVAAAYPLWSRNGIDARGEFGESTARASTIYHLVGAIAALDLALAR